MIGDPLDDAASSRATGLPEASRTRSSVLIVEPDAQVGRKLRAACLNAAAVTLCSDFEGGRSELERNPPKVLVTNLRLEAYNGLHLVLLSQMSGIGARCVVHTDRPDFLLVSEALAMGAFFERTERLTFSVVGYIWGALPAADRRDPMRVDRRASFRGGRRASDNQEIAGAISP